MENSSNPRNVDAWRAQLSSIPYLQRPPVHSQTFRQLAFIFAHFGDEPLRSQFAEFVPEHLRSGQGNRSDESAREKESQHSHINGFAPEFARPCTDDDGHNDLVVANQKEASSELNGANSVEDGKSDCQIETVIEKNAGVMSKEQNVHVSGAVLIEPGQVTGDKENDKVVSGGSRTGDGSAEVINCQDHLSNIEKMLMDESENMGKLLHDNDESSFNISEGLDSFWNMDVIGDGSITVEKGEEGGIAPLEGLIAAETGSEKKDMEIEVYRGGVNYPHVAIDGGPEEGEINDGSGVCDLSADIFAEDAMTIEKKKTEKEKVSEPVSNKDVFTFNAQAAENHRGTGSNNNSEGLLDNEGKAAKSNVRGSDYDEIICKSASVGRSKIKEGRKAARKDTAVKSRKNKNQVTQTEEILNNPVSCGGEALPLGRTLKEHANENGGNMSAVTCCAISDEKLGPSSDEKIEKKEVSDISKKRKRGPSSEERKAKKKQKERKRRAEKNRKLGVRRLKIQPVLKPKPVEHCRHYLRGRCHEGEKCKFSHDVMPLTKSKPCFHFARQICMKGDDCPYDHELSKYPCHNFVREGFCSRGDRCMFSHKTPAKENFKSSVDVSKSEQKSLAPPDKSNSKQHLNSGASCSSETLAPRSPKVNVAICKQDQSERAPGGLSFFSFGKSLLDNFSKQKQVISYPKNGNGVETGILPSQGSSGSLLNSNEMSEGSQTLSAPRGISFLSFGTTSSNNSGDNKPHGMPTQRGDHFDSSVRDKESTDRFQLPNVKPQDLQSSPISSVLRSKRVEDGEVKGTPNTVPRALLSTLAFAAKYESVIKMNPSVGASPAANSVEVNKTPGAGSSSGAMENEPMNASAVFDLLYGGSSKETK
ncbi:hypothetical protein Nepgr_005927 [Nepenthes gracilis]|uniref:C3H1-type domain-containing protein n=1 Tax=Nepenthes gracilis TaxID=150966 RepID=A0AAD3S477_NEPGR|nr:hypothetical protein Nepgr_005927 [Nepenthes gracilis]